jgi:uroporphyrin-III C-methyltransferase
MNAWPESKPSERGTGFRHEPDPSGVRMNHSAEPTASGPGMTSGREPDTSGRKTPMAAGREAAGRVWLVGAGPGAADLLTVRAIRAIRGAGVLLVDDLVGPEVLRYARRSARVVHVGKRGGCRSTPQAFIEQLMLREAQAGERVVRLKGGDPTIFGRGGEEAEFLRAHGVEVEIVPGITAGLAAAGALGAPLTHRAHAHGVIFVTGHAKDEAAALDWGALGAAAAQGLTLVVYMGVAQAAALQAGLRRALPGATPVGIAQNASRPEQRVAHTTLDGLLRTLAEQRLGSPAILIVGDVLRGAAALHHEMPIQAAA